MSRGEARHHGAAPPARPPALAHLRLPCFASGGPMVAPWRNSPWATTRPCGWTEAAARSPVPLLRLPRLPRRALHPFHCNPLSPSSTLPAPSRAAPAWRTSSCPTRDPRSPLRPLPSRREQQGPRGALAPPHRAARPCATPRRGGRAVRARRPLSGVPANRAWLRGDERRAAHRVTQRRVSHQQANPLMPRMPLPAPTRFSSPRCPRAARSADRVTPTPPPTQDLWPAGPGGALEQPGVVGARPL